MLIPSKHLLKSAKNGPNGFLVAIHNSIKKNKNRLLYNVIIFIIKKISKNILKDTKLFILEKKLLIMIY